MSANIWDVVEKTIDEQLVEQLASDFRVASENCLLAIQSAVPSLVEALVTQASTLDGAESVFRAVEEYDGSMVNNFRMIVFSGDYQDIVTAGQDSLWNLFGPEYAENAARVSQCASVSREVARSILCLVAPLAFAIVGEEKRTYGLNRDGVIRVITSQLDHFSIQLPETLVSHFVHTPEATAAQQDNPATWPAEAMPKEDMADATFVLSDASPIIPDLIPDAEQEISPANSANIQEVQVDQDPSPDITADGVLETTSGVSPDLVPDDTAELMPDVALDLAADDLPESTPDESPDLPGQAVKDLSSEENDHVEDSSDEPHDRITRISATDGTEEEYNMEDSVDSQPNLLKKAILPLVMVMALWIYTLSMFGNRAKLYIVSRASTPQSNELSETSPTQLNVASTPARTEGKKTFDAVLRVATQNVTAAENKPDPEEASKAASDPRADTNIRVGDYRIPIIPGPRRTGRSYYTYPPKVSPNTESRQTRPNS